ncbi:CoA transferase [Streptomyces zhihengii]
MPHYAVYETSDGGWMAVGTLEPQFYAAFTALLGLDAGELPDRADPRNWPALRTLFANRFKTATRARWTDVFEGTDACVAPVLSLREAAGHPHLTGRGTYTEAHGITQPAPAPASPAPPAPCGARRPSPGPTPRRWRVTGACPNC